MSYTPKNNFNLQLKRTDAGEKGFREKLWKTITGTCDALDYFFRWEPLFEGLGRSDFRTIEVTGGIGDFNWSIVGAGFTLDNAVTAGRTNVVRSDGTIFTGDDAVVTVVDSCGSSVEGGVKGCYVSPCGGLPPIIYDEWSSCFTSFYQGQLEAIEQIGDLVYLIVAPTHGGDNYQYHLYSWDGISGTLTGIITDYILMDHNGGPVQTVLIGNTIYVSSPAGTNMISWTLGESVWTNTPGLGMPYLVKHNGALWSPKSLSTQVAALYEFFGGSWIERARYLDKRLLCITLAQSLSFGFNLYTGCWSYPGSPPQRHELRKYVPGAGTPEDPHDMMVCLTQPENNSVMFNRCIEKDGSVYATALDGRLYKKVPYVQDPSLEIDLVANAPVCGGNRFELIYHDSFIFGLSSYLELFRWSGAGDWIVSAAGPGAYRQSQMFSFKGRLYAAKGNFMGDFCIIRWGA